MIGRVRYLYNIIFEARKAMFKSLIGLAFALPALADSVKEDLAEMQCQAMTTTSGTIFSVTGIEGADDYVWEL